MSDTRTKLLALWLLVIACGCAGHRQGHDPVTLAPAVVAPATRIEEACVEPCSFSDARQSLPPLDPNAEPEFWDLDLQAVIQLCLENSDVFRDLGGLVLDAPDNVATIFDPAIQETDPLYGVNAALSAFDASLSAGAFVEKNDRALNNIFEGGGTRLFKQDLGLYSFELSKRTGVGTDLYLRNLVDYDYNNAPGNNVPNLPWLNRMELEFRQPLLQGAGVAANQIAGQSGAPGVYNGVMVARVKSDISLAEFETAVRDLISTVENAYWELYFAYRDLDAAQDARERAKKTWNEVRALAETGRSGGERARLSQAEEQFFRLDAAVEDAIWGRAIDDTRSNLFQGHGGVYASERRLRLALGIPVSDGRLIRPLDQPPLAEVLFDWEQMVAESLDRRVELRRQRWQVKQRELEVRAAQNFVLPRLDAVGGYRFRGLGEDLIHSDRDGRPQFDNAVANLTSGDFQEWQMGLDLTMPIGNRRARTAARHAQLRLARERAILHEQERQIIGGLSNALAEKQRAFLLAQKNFNRSKAAQEQMAALEAEFQEADGNERTRLLDLLLNAQLLAADAESRFHRALAEYMVAVKNVHYEKGSLLALNKIHLSEGPWPGNAYQQAGDKAAARWASPTLSHFVKRGVPAVSQGVFPQEIDTTPAMTKAPASPTEPEDVNEGNIESTRSGQASIIAP